MQALLRSFATYVPKSQIVLSKPSPHLLYSYEGYHDDRLYMKYFLCIPPIFGFLWGTEYFLTHKFSNTFLSSFKLTLALSTFPVFYILGNKNRVVEMSLHTDGQHIDLQLAGKLKCHSVTFPISECKWDKINDSFRVKHENKEYFLDQDGKIHDLDLFYAVLRSLSVEPGFITVKDN